MENTGEISLIDTTRYDENGINCCWQTYSYQNSSVSIDYSEGLFFKIDSIATKESDRRKGYATKLLNYVKKIAKELDVLAIQIYLPIDGITPRKEYSLKDYNVAVSFFKKNGFIFYPKSTVKMFFDLNKMETDGEIKSTSRWRPEFIKQLKPIDLNKMQTGGIVKKAISKKSKTVRMKNKVLALLISLGSVIGLFGIFLLLFFYPNLCWVYISLSTLFLIYQGYDFWLKKLNDKNK